MATNGAILEVTDQNWADEVDGNEGLTMVDFWAVWCGPCRMVAPIVEELAFRGFLLRRLIASDFTKVPYDKWHWPAVLISSLAFAAAHQQWIGGFAAGVLYAYAQKRRGLLSDAIVAHAVTNALIAIQVLFAGHWSLW